MLAGIRRDAVIWRGFKHCWDYNHRLNRFGSYARLGDGGAWVVGHTAASGTGPDTAEAQEIYGVLESPDLLARPGVTSISIEAAKGTMYMIDREIEIGLDPALAAKDRYAIVLNGFDLWSKDGASAHKMMAFALEVGQPRLSDDGQRLTFDLDGSFQAHCKSPECRGYPGRLRRHKARYELRAYTLLLAGDAETFNVVRPTQNATREYAWSNRGDEIKRQRGRTTLQIPLPDGWQGSAVANAPGLHRLAIDLKKTGGHVATRGDPSMHLLGWDMAITDLRRDSDSVTADLLLFFKNWARGMKATHRPHSEGSLRDAGRVKLEAGVTLLQAKGGAYNPGQASTNITWRAQGPASSEKARQEKDIEH
jgi:hypothetical protein